MAKKPKIELNPDPGFVYQIVGMVDWFIAFFEIWPSAKYPGYYYAGGFHTEFFGGNAHGTQVASIIVAKNDDAGMAGLARFTSLRIRIPPMSGIRRSVKTMS